MTDDFKEALSRAQDILEDGGPHWLGSTNLCIEVRRPPETRYYWRMNTGTFTLDVSCEMALSFMKGGSYYDEAYDEAYDLHQALYKAWVFSLVDAWYALPWYDQEAVCFDRDWPERVAAGERGMPLPEMLAFDLAHFNSTGFYG